MRAARRQTGSINSLELLKIGKGGLRIAQPVGHPYSLAIAGDFNADGISDHVVGAPSMSDSGAVYIVLGGGLKKFDASTFTSGSFGCKIRGSAIGDKLGTAVGAGGDINDDGFDDLLIGAPNAGLESRPGSGIVYVIFGRKGPYDDILLSSFEAGILGFKIVGESTNSMLGLTSASLEGALQDINGDGIDDIAIGCAVVDYLGRHKAGVVHVIYGQSASAAIEDIDLALPLEGRGVKIGGESAGDNLGSALSGAGDVNGDGVRDLLIGCTGCDPLGRTEAGAAYLIYGHKGLTDMDLSKFAYSDSGIMFMGAAPYSKLGTAVSSAADLNGDGVTDVVLGAPGTDGVSSVGCVHVFYGSDSERFANTIDLSTLEAGKQGYSVCDGDGDLKLGTSISYAGDVDRDGLDDVLLGAGDGGSGGSGGSRGSGDTDGAEGDGAVYLLYGEAAVPNSDIRLTEKTSTCLVLPASYQPQPQALPAGTGDVFLTPYTVDSAPLFSGAARIEPGVKYVIECSSAASLPTAALWRLLPVLLCVMMLLRLL